MVKRKGFTLIEIVIAVSIVVILASLAVPKVSGYLDKAKNSKAVAIGKQLYSAAMWSYSEKGGKFDSADVIETIKMVTGIESINASSLTIPNNKNIAIAFSSDDKSYIITINAENNGFLILNDSKTVFSSIQQ